MNNRSPTMTDIDQRDVRKINEKKKIDIFAPLENKKLVEDQAKSKRIGSLTDIGKLRI